MKNKSSVILILITCIFAAFTLGFLAGRATAPRDTIITRLSEDATATTEAVVPDRTVALPTVAATTPPETTVAPETTMPSAETEPTGEIGSGLININTATLAELDTLPGIGPVIAQRIIDYREAHGPFTALGQLMQVEGIGEKRLTDILDLITIE